jgi:hypothetical protein
MHMKGTSGRLEKFNLTATQAILYFNSLDPGETITLPYRVRTLFSCVYEYYDPEVNAIARPVQRKWRSTGCSNVRRNPRAASLLEVVVHAL